MGYAGPASGRSSVKRFALLSVLALAALAIWLAHPAGEEPASPAWEPSRSDAGNARVPMRAPVAADRSAAPMVARPQRIAPPSEASAHRETGAASEPLAALRASGGTLPGGANDAAPRPARAPAAVPRERASRAPILHRTDRPAPDLVQLEQLVELAVPEGSVPPEQLDEARQGARARTLEEQLVLEQLARDSIGENPSEKEVRDRRDLGRTLLSAEAPETQERIMRRAAERIDAQP